MTAPLLIVVLLLFAGLVGLLGLGGALYLFARSASVVSWRGQRIELVRGQLHREIRVDDKLVAWALRGRPGWTHLKGVLTDGALGEVPIVWVGARPTLQAVYVGGNRISGTLTDRVAQAASEWPEPTDPRWPAARALLESLDRSNDPEVREASRKIGHGLRDALRHLQMVEAPARIPGDNPDVRAARLALDEDVERWVIALRALHLQATVSAGSADGFLAHSRVETEGDAVVRAKARALAARLGRPE